MCSDDQLRNAADILALSTEASEVLVLISHRTLQTRHFCDVLVSVVGETDWVNPDVSKQYAGGPTRMLETLDQCAGDKTVPRRHRGINLPLDGRRESGAALTFRNPMAVVVCVLRRARGSTPPSLLFRCRYFRPTPEPGKVEDQVHTTRDMHKFFQIPTLDKVLSCG